MPLSPLSTIARTAAQTIVLAATAPAIAMAAPLTAQEVMQQFNLVVLGDATSTSDVEGRSFISGNLQGPATFASRTLPASTYAGLTVLGNASQINVNNNGIADGGSLSYANVNNGGGVVFGNSINTNFNGSTPSYVAGTRSGNANSGIVASPAVNSTLQGYADSRNSTDFGAVMGEASAAIKALTANSTITINGSKATFTVVPDASGRAVFDIANDASFFATVHEFNFVLGSATSVFINSDLASGTLNANFLGGSAQAIGAKVIWNFSDATALTIDSQWGGSVLAPHAAVTTWNNIEGTLIAASLKQHGEIHQQQFTGTVPVSVVPEPQTWALMLVGIAALGGIARRREQSGH